MSRTIQIALASALCVNLKKRSDDREPLNDGSKSIITFVADPEVL